MRHALRFPSLLLAGCLSLAGTTPSPGQAPVRGPLVVFNAGSLALPFNRLLKAFMSRHPEVVPAQENSGSLEAARKITELGKIPDVLGVADYGVIPALLVPRYADWYATFAANAMVLVYTAQSIGAREINGSNWPDILLRPDVRWGHADPALDPNGYRTLMVFQLAERHYRQPGLAARLDAAISPRYTRPKEADLTALVQVGELDYAWSYLSIARTSGLLHVDLPKEIDLSDPAWAGEYASARVRLPGASRAAGDSVEFRGDPIVYALTIPKGAPHPAAAEAFVAFVLSADGRRILAETGLTPLATPRLGGSGRPPLSLRRLLTTE